MLPPFAKLSYRLPLVLLIAVTLIPPLIISYIFRLPYRRVGAFYIFKIFLWVAAIKIRVHGPLPERGTLILSNHVSWLDIPLIGSILPVEFVAKSDVAKWPIFGYLASVTQTIFIEREKRSETMKQKNVIQQRLTEGARVVLFPEGSTSNGTIVLPFKSALLASAETPEDGVPIKIQPMTLVFSELCGIPMGRRMRVEYAWIGHSNLIPHMLKVLGGEPITVDIIFYPPTNLENEGGRKCLAISAHRQVQDGLAAFTVGHDTQFFSAEKPENDSSEKLVKKA